MLSGSAAIRGGGFAEFVELASGGDVANEFIIPTLKFI
jgi:hypothetical protein